MDRDYVPVVTIFGFGFFGIIMAAIAKVANDEGVIIDEFITGSITITDLMAIIIIIFLLAGVVVAVVRS
jgi:hypothetical protein